jgi:hypothetical protein
MRERRWVCGLSSKLDFNCEMRGHWKGGNRIIFSSDFKFIVLIVVFKVLCFEERDCWQEESKGEIKRDNSTLLHPYLNYDIVIVIFVRDLFPPPSSKHKCLFGLISFLHRHYIAIVCKISDVCAKT